MKKMALMSLLFVTPIPVLAQPLPCSSFTGIPVPYIPNPALNNVGVAHTMQNGQPVIVMNPNVVGPLPEFVRQFWYAHECAHHALHPMHNSEMNADCYAIKAIRNIGLISNPQQVGFLLNYISTLPGNIMTGHLPGPARAQNMYACFATP
ncbi:MAG: hypothetical protein Q8S20_02890 [Sulfuritalea sp.]|nr:hypothetical protein [Sulfuritalea sp.]